MLGKDRLGGENLSFSADLVLWCQRKLFISWVSISSSIKLDNRDFHLQENIAYSFCKVQQF